MPRWPKQTRTRLVDAALDLFMEHGYGAVTVDDIAARANVSARTFFRHFPDKEEVLFADDDTLLLTVVDSITTLPFGVSTAEKDMVAALNALAVELEPHRQALAQRQQTIDSHVSLTGRELAKQARWQQAVTEALSDRGYSRDDASMLAAIGFAIFRQVLHSWLSDKGDEASLSFRVREAIPRVRTVLDASTGAASLPRT